jgi:acyl carrier protein
MLRGVRVGVPSVDSYLVAPLGALTPPRKHVGDAMNDSVDALIADALRIPADRVTDSLEFQGIPEWDSMGHLSLMLALEDRFEIHIPDEVVVELTNVPAIRAFVTNLGANGEAAGA